jgi:Heterokaryon incompatibility protein (HET)
MAGSEIYRSLSLRSIRVLILEPSNRHEDPLRGSPTEVELPPATWFQEMADFLALDYLDTVFRERSLPRILTSKWDPERIDRDTISRYEALSYVWGSPTRDHSIWCNGNSIFVTVNCDQALRHLRYKTKKRVLWVDAICIN